MKNIFILIILILFLYELLNHPELVISSSNYASKLWFNNIFPTLLPFFIISTLLINYGFIDLLNYTVHPLFNKLFNISKQGTYIFFLSLFSGIPSNAKYIVDLYNENMIDKNEGTKLLCFTFFSNPLFIMGALANNMLNNKKVGLIILISHYIPNIIIGLFLRNKFKSCNTNNYNKRISNNNFGKIITNSLISSINTLLLILGIISLFSLIINILINNFNLNKTLISAILEITQGLNNVSLLDLSLKTKVILSTIILSFGGLSSHLQIISIISNTDIKYFPFLISRFFHVILSLIISFFIYNLF